MKILFKTMIIFIIALGLFWWQDFTHSFGLIEALITVILAHIFKLITMKKIELQFLWYSIVNYKKKVRISYAYLIRVYHPEKGYLLVRGNGKKHNKLKPIGGAYKSIDLSYLEILPGSRRQSELNEKDDVRFFIPGKHLLKFLRIVKSSNKFEYGCRREFDEEVFGSNILSQEKMGILKFNLEGTKIDYKKNIHYKKDEPNCDFEILYNDIFCLNLSDAQSMQLMELPKCGDKYCFVGTEEIKINDNNYIIVNDRQFTVADHTYKIREGEKYDI